MCQKQEDYPNLTTGDPQETDASGNAPSVVTE